MKSRYMYNSDATGQNTILKKYRIMLNIDDFILTNCIYISLLSNAFVLIHEYYTNDLLAIQGYNKNSNGKCR